MGCGQRAIIQLGHDPVTKPRLVSSIVTHALELQLRSKPAQPLCQRMPYTTFSARPTAGQFFEDLAEYAHKWAEEGATVIIAALDGDAQRRPFPGVMSLVPLAESVVKLSAVCHTCHEDASFSMKLDATSPSDPQVVRVRCNSAIPNTARDAVAAAGHILQHEAAHGRDGLSSAYVCAGCGREGKVRASVPPVLRIRQGQSCLANVSHRPLACHDLEQVRRLALPLRRSMICLPAPLHLKQKKDRVMLLRHLTYVA